MTFPQTGQVFEAYHLRHVLGEGGQAVVFLAHSEMLGYEVALKVLLRPRDGYPADIVARFRRELNVVSQLRSPHTVRLLNHGTSADGLLYAAFEYVPGDDLADRLENVRQLDVPTTITILTQVLESLAEAHRLGLVHRDIKPANIRVVSQAPGQLHTLQVKVLDFGIARQARPDATAVTNDGQLVGTPRYMAPEQLREGELTPAADVYTTGLLGHELVFGPDILAGNRLADQLERLQTGIKLTAVQVSSVDPHLLQWLRRATAANPEARFRNAGEALVALHTRGPAPDPAPRAARATISLVPVAVAMVIAALLAGAAVWFLARPEPQEPRIVVRRAVPSITKSAVIESAQVDVGAPVVDEPEVTCGTTKGFIGDGLVSDAFDQWVVHIPPGYDGEQRLPVVVIYNDAFDAYPRAVLDNTELRELAAAKNFVILAPFDQDPMNYVWTTPSKIRNSRNAVTAVTEQLCVDASRIYAIGSGNGGRAVEELRCGRFAAIATVRYRRDSRAEIDVVAPPPTCRPPVPHLHIATTDDQRFPLEGGRGSNMFLKRVGLADKEEVHRKLNGCSTTEQKYSSESGDCITWKGCDAPFVSCRIDGVSAWPKTPSHADRPVTTFPTAEAIWDFFEKAEPLKLEN